MSTPGRDNVDYRCLQCVGTGRDHDKTQQARAKGDIGLHENIRCWACNGNGLDFNKFMRRAPNDPHQPR